jgi:hypothetical protein
VVDDNRSFLSRDRHYGFSGQRGSPLVMSDTSEGGKLSFGQAQGLEPLPTQLQLGEISQQLRALVWRSLYLSMDTHSVNDKWGSGKHFVQNWKRIFFDYHVNVRHQFADDFKNNSILLIKIAKNIISDGDYIEFFNFIQYVLAHDDCPPGVDLYLADALKDGRAAYRIIEKRIVPIASEEQAASIEQTFIDLDATKYGGARRHLREAARGLMRGDYASSIRDSIHAVESVAIVVEPSADSLGKALATIEKKGHLHGGLKAAFASMYGYTSDEEGIRHASVFKSVAQVEEADAMFMFSACAAFVSYLIAQDRRLTGNEI